MKKQFNYNQTFYNAVSTRAEETANLVSDLCDQIFETTSLIDIGSGEGIWTHVFSKSTKCSMSVAVDMPGTHFKYLKNKSPNIQILERDFETSIDLPSEVFDLSICVEVIEHLTKETSEELLNYISSHSKVAVFSGATIGQGGTHHINEQSQEFWLNAMKSRGMTAFDVVRPILRNKKGIPGYYKNNIFLYVSLDKFEKTEVIHLLNKLGELETLNFQDIRSISAKATSTVLRLLPHSLVTKIAKIKSLIVDTK